MGFPATIAGDVIVRRQKMSVRNQLTDDELGEFFCSLRDLLVLSLDAN